MFTARGDWEQHEIERQLAIRRLDDFIKAKRIKKRRRKLGQNGFSVHKMAIPKKR